MEKLVDISSTTTVSEVKVLETDAGRYYAIYKGDTLIKGWIKGNGSTIVFDNLDPDTTYTVKTILKSDYDEAQNKPKENATIDSNNAKTKINPLNPNKSSDLEAVVTAEVDEIIVDNLISNYKYKLIDEDGKTIAEYAYPKSNKLIFSNLKSNTTYYLVALTDTNVETGKVPIKTKEIVAKTVETVKEGKNVTKNPQTYDGILNYVVLSIILSIGIVGIIVYRKKQNI